jgi:hypothetical protein
LSAQSGRRIPGITQREGGKSLYPLADGSSESRGSFCPLKSFTSVGLLKTHSCSPAKLAIEANNLSLRQTIKAEIEASPKVFPIALPNEAMPRVVASMFQISRILWFDLKNLKVQFILLLTLRISLSFSAIALRFRHFCHWMARNQKGGIDHLFLISVACLIHSRLF